MRRALPSEMVAVGQSFELMGEPENLFTITAVKPTYNKVDGELWFVTIMCIVPPRFGWTMGSTGVEATRSGTLSTPWRRIA